jgi:hypothetical protein
MRMLEHFKFSMRGFSPKRATYMLNFFGLISLLLEKYAASEFREGIMELGLINFIVVGILTFFIPKPDPGRWIPIQLSTIVLFLDMLLVPRF